MKRGWLQLAAGIGAVALAWGVWVAWPRGEGAPLVPSGTEKDAVSLPSALQEREAGSERQVGTPRATLVRGRAVDPTGAPLAGVGIRLRDEKETLGTSGEDGSFEIALPRLDVVLDTSDPDRSALRWRRVTAKNRDEVHLLVLAPAVSLTGFIVNVSGTTLAGEVYVAVPGRVHEHMPSDLTAGTERRMYRYRTDTRGRFVLEQIPFGPETTIHGCVEGHSMREQMLVPSASKHNLRLVVKRPGQRKPDHPYLRGLVLDPAGNPAREAEVTFGRFRAKSDVIGEFVLLLDPLEKIPPEAEIVVTKPGHLPRVEGGYGELVCHGYPFPPPVTLLLGPPALSISGTVVDPEGKPPPLPSFIEVLDKTPFRDGEKVEDLARPEPSATDSEYGYGVILPTGEFTITGLTARKYTLAVTSGRLRTRKVFEGISAGSSGIVLRIEPGPQYERVLGVVQGPSGEPLPGIHVDLEFEGIDHSYWSNVDQQVTDLQGRFELMDVPREHAQLSFRGDSVIAFTLPVESIHTPRQFVVNPRLSSTIIVAVPANSPWYRLEFQLQAEGKSEPIHSCGFTRGNDKILVWPGRPPQEQCVGAGTYTALFTDEYTDTVVSKETVELRPGTRTTISPVSSW